ncbi:MAG TPA: CoA pyrophosphatase [Steroidobacteraceae bacterium]|nr:CoA pyrophosphatase [Steroidobacteraceae bacterium]
MTPDLNPDELRSRILRRFEGTQPRHELADWRLLGVDAERSRRLQRHFPANPVPAAVLVALVDRPEGLTVLLTERASQLAQHAAQVSFPGGRLEESDPDVASAALREAQEEIGLDPARVRVFGYLPDHLVISGFRVTPVLSLVTPPFELTPNPAEVAEVFEVPLSHVFDRNNHKARLRRVGDEDLLLYDIPWQGQHIWGATAGMLLTFVRMVQEGQP